MLEARVISDLLEDIGKIRQLSGYYASAVAAETCLMQDRLSVVDVCLSAGITRYVGYLQCSPVRAFFFINTLKTFQTKRRKQKV